MKYSKIILPVLLAVVLLSTLVACAEKEATQPVTQAVTNESGEVVTDENGEVVTEELEAVIVTDKEGNAVTEVVTTPEGKPVTTVVNNQYVNVTQYVTKAPTGSATTKATTAKKGGTTKKGETTTKKSDKESTSTTKESIKKPDAPKTISKISVSDVKEESLKLSWTKVDCTGYQIQISEDNISYSNLEKSYTKTTYTVKDLTSYTDYYFRIRPFNKNDAGTTVGEWTYASAKTDEDTTSRRITVNVNLPNKNGADDTLIIQIGSDKEEVAVKLDGSVYQYKSTKKYKGAVTVTATLKEQGNSYSLSTDKDKITLDISADGIYIIEGEDD